MSQKFQITLPDDLASELKQEAAQHGIPVAEFIRQTIREKLRPSRSPSPRQQAAAGQDCGHRQQRRA